jgi:hypothetical protein
MFSILSEQYCNGVRTCPRSLFSISVKRITKSCFTPGFPGLEIIFARSPIMFERVVDEIDSTKAVTSLFLSWIEEFLYKIHFEDRI